MSRIIQFKFLMSCASSIYSIAFIFNTYTISINSNIRSIKIS